MGSFRLLPGATLLKNNESKQNYRVAMFLSTMVFFFLRIVHNIQLANAYNLMATAKLSIEYV